MNCKSAISFEELTSELDDYLQKNPKLRKSDRRKQVLRVIYESDEHLTPDEIYSELKNRYKEKVGISTVYRNLTFFEDLGLVNSTAFSGDTKRYEINCNIHHDHLNCTNCGAIVEFNDERIERLQQEIAKERGFELKDHTMTLYGVCQKCKESRES